MAKQLKSLLCEIVNDWNSPRTHWVLLPKLKYVSLFFFSSSSNYRKKKNVNETNIMFKLQLEYAIFQLENWDGERLAIELWWNRKTIERMNKRCRKKTTTVTRRDAMRFECEVILLYVRAVQAIMVKCTQALYIWDSYTLSILQAVNSICIHKCITLVTI